MVKEGGEVVEGYKPGDRVIAFTCYGAFAEEVKTEAARLVPLPQDMDFNSGAAFYVSGRAANLQEGIRVAAESIDSGKARQKLQQLAELTNAA